MKIVIFGSTGQLGLSLADTQPAQVDVAYIGRADCDLSDDRAIGELLDSHNPSLVINAAAYTQVDKAESEPEIAFQVNAGAPQKMAMWTRDHGARIIHISTDFVFSGSNNKPYLPGDDPHPLGVYGQSKLLGENVARGFSNQQAMIIRTSWVYSEHGSNFVKTMLRLMAEREELSVVNDQYGSPTYARGLAVALWRIIQNELHTPGIFHWADEGNISWYQFATAIQDLAMEAGILNRSIPILPISTDEYPTPAVRPAYSVLDTTELYHLLGGTAVGWQDNLKSAIERISTTLE